MADIRRHFSEDIRQLNPDLFGQETITSHAALNAALAMDTKEEKRNKFGARKTTVGEFTFDSQKEANRYLELKGMEERGEIRDLLLQCQINLMEGFTFQGEKVRAINYTCDFCYMEGRFTVIEDVKSEATARTEAFRLRWRLLQWHYRDVPDVKLVQT